MFSANFLRASFIAAGALLLLPAVAAFLGSGPEQQGACRRLCWLYELTANFGGTSAANVFIGILWLALAIAFVVVGIRIGSPKRNQDAV